MPEVIEMLTKEYITRELDTLNKAELRQVADFVAFLKFRAARAVDISALDAGTAQLYAEFAEEDRLLAEQGMGEYFVRLQHEDEL